MSRFLLLTVALLLAVFFVSTVFADDFWPPDFRGDPLSYTAFWEFTNDPGAGDIYPDNILFTGDGVHGLFNAQTHTHLDPTVFWGNPAGYIWTGDEPGVVRFFLNNWIDPYVYKHIWVQVTYDVMVPLYSPPPYVSGVEGADSSDQWSNPYIGYFVERFEVDERHFVEYWQIQPNPNMEYVYLYLPPETSIDEVVIDTWSTDSPIENQSKSWGEVKSMFR